jgi:type II secretory pathway component PulF
MAASGRDRAVYYRGLSTLLATGAPASIAMKAAADGVRSGALRRAASDAAYRAGSGLGVAEALAHHPEVFDAADIAVLQAAETTGDLDRALLRLAEEAETAGAVSRRIRAGLLYPAVLWHVAAFVPPIADYVRDGFGAYLGKVLMLLVPFYGIVAILLWLGRSRSGRVLRSRILGHVPFVGKALRRSELARFLRVLANAHDAGLGPVEAATTAFGSTTQAELRSAGRSGLEILAAGNPFHRFFAVLPWLDEADAMVLATAESTGDLAGALRRLAARHEEMARQAAETTVRLLPLAVYLFVAAYIVWVVVSFYAGYYGSLGRF